ncbi:hypothetical protein [Streptomyces aidingensis]|uniref:Uncharacterized protein n=1 Tax=Streptomyces aidingensis TaxID=910347 RepID=A0A1I1PRI6_9ACTN|nr:hypothetical protein [Streptomyces aidingensis]SFD08570.1 hypothetical protein SAMN05421773_109153 [Streptomyces aidingensis]
MPRTRKPAGPVRPVTSARDFTRETVRTVAVLADEASFARMHQYAAFRHESHPDYLRRLERHLRRLLRNGGYTQVALFDPEEYAEFCTVRELDPGHAASRARYAGEIATAGPAVRYRGQPLARLLPELVAVRDRQQLWSQCRELLLGAGSCPGCGTPHADCGVRRAAAGLAAVLAGTGPGAHHLVCTVLADSGPLSAAMHAERDARGSTALPEPDTMLLSMVLAVALATGRAGGLVLREAGSGGEAVLGWATEDGWLRPLSEAEIFAAYCTDPHSGEPVPPEPGITYRAAPPLPPPPPCPGP